MYTLLRLMEENARYSVQDLADLLAISPQEVEEQIAAYEAQGIIRGYKTIIDWDKTERDVVTARIELKVTPKKDHGFEEIAHRIAQYDEVQSLYLMSGGYDLAVTIVGKSFKEIASFVAYRLAPIDGVQSTATHFVLRKYKEKGAILVDKTKDERGIML